MATTLMSRAIVGSLLAGLSLVASSSPAATFRGLGDLAGGAFSSGANGVSPDGCFAVGVAASAQGNEAFRWDSVGGMIGLGDLPGGTAHSGAWAVSAGGQVVVGTSGAAGGLEAFRWTRTTGMVGIGDLSGGSHASVAHAVSADGGTIVGYGASPAGQEAFRWSAQSGIVGLGDLAGGESYSAAAGVSANGTVIVGLGTSATGTYAVSWTAGGAPLALGDLPGGDVFNGANAVSADGSIVVGVDYSELPGEAFVWTTIGGMAGLGYLDVAKPFPASQAFDISASGYIVAGYASSAMTGLEAIIWDPQHGMRRVADVLTEQGLNLAGWRLTEATGISDDGRVVVGRGVNPAGQSEAWWASIDSSSQPLRPGDANLDGRVDHLDLAIVSSNFGRLCGPAFRDGDLSGDGAVSLSDLVILRANYRLAPQAAAVPEPSTMLVALLGLIAMAPHAKRKLRAKLPEVRPTGQ